MGLFLFMLICVCLTALALTAIEILNIVEENRYILFIEVVVILVATILSLLFISRTMFL